MSRQCPTFAIQQTSQGNSETGVSLEGLHSKDRSFSILRGFFGTFPRAAIIKNDSRLCLSAKRCESLPFLSSASTDAVLSASALDRSHSPLARSRAVTGAFFHSRSVSGLERDNHDAHYTASRACQKQPRELMANPCLGLHADIHVRAISAFIAPQSIRTHERRAVFTACGVLS